MSKQASKTWLTVSVLISTVLSILLSAIICGLFEGTIVNHGHFVYQDDVNMIMNSIGALLVGMFVLGVTTGMILKRKAK